MTPNFEVGYNAQAPSGARRFVREENLRAPITLPNTAAWYEARVAAAGQIRLCLMNSQREQQAGKAIAGLFGHEDGQSAFALAVLSCAQP
ncbi:MAG: hypothetical protein HC883_03210 [Bdellovibrionaceae bacterium]|nr:hypothetical protein [Pseudobdellovibrionaceae bacterium]